MSRTTKHWACKRVYYSLCILHIKSCSDACACIYTHCTL